MACGLPVVSVDSQEGAVQHGKNGYVVPQRDSNAIVDAVLKIYDKNQWKQMGNISKEIVKDYDWNIIAKKAIIEYEKLIREKS